MHLGHPPARQPVTAVDAAFVEKHQKQVRDQAKRIRAQFDLRTDIDDLIAYGMQGLLEARQRFNPEHGVRFEHFAYYRIRGAIVDGVRRMAYLPRRIHQQRRAAETLDRTAEEVAIARAKSPEERASVSATLRAMDDILGKTSAAYLIGAMGQDTELNAPPDPEAHAIAAEDRLRLRRALEVLDPRERKIVEGYYLQGRTLESIGKELGMSKSWASRICSRALTRMRSALGP